VTQPRVGRQGYVLKPGGPDLVQRSRSVRTGSLEPGISRTVVRVLARLRSADRCVHAEREVLQLVVEGKTTKEIARLRA